MPVSVCPSAVVAAPAEVVWSLLMRPETYDLWADAHIERVTPEGPAVPGQVISASSPAFGKRWDVRLEIGQINAEKRQIDVTTTLPLGIQVHNHITCAPLDERSCRLQFG
ncbi:MAG TPA: SRPBCC family protein [Ktedonobacterales bacterium]|nr:SRPBCC family protein [Ktedonobacterales bacterium]